MLPLLSTGGLVTAVSADWNMPRYAGPANQTSAGGQRVGGPGSAPVSEDMRLLCGLNIHFLSWSNRHIIRQSMFTESRESLIYQSIYDLFIHWSVLKSFLYLSICVLLHVPFCVSLPECIVKFYFTTLKGHIISAVYINSSASRLQYISVLFLVKVPGLVLYDQVTHLEFSVLKVQSWTSLKDDRKVICRCALCTQQYANMMSQLTVKA